MLCLAATACVAEMEVCMALMSPADLRSALLLHMVTAFILLLSVVYLKSGAYDFKFSLLLLLGTALLGPYGAALGFLSPLVYVMVRSPDRRPMEWLNAFFPSFRISENDRIQEKLVSGSEKPFPQHGIDPFQDVLLHGTILQKQLAIAKMTRYFCPQFAPLLLKAARNPEPAVRVQAATALANIERRFMEQRMRLENELKRVPEPKKQLELAHLYDDYAYTGLADKENRHAFRDQAIRIYKTYLESTNDPETSVRLARLYIREGRMQEAVDLLHPYALSGSLGPQAASWYMEALFRQRRLKELRDFSASIAGQEKPFLPHHSHKLGEIMPLWDKTGGMPLEYGWEKANAS